MKKYNIEVYKLKELSENAQIKANKEFKRLIPFDLTPLTDKLKADYKKELIKNGFKVNDKNLSIFYSYSSFYFKVIGEFQFKEYTLLSERIETKLIKKNNKKVCFKDDSKLSYQETKIIVRLYEISNKLKEKSKILFEKEYYKQLKKAVFFKNGNLFNKSML